MVNKASLSVLQFLLPQQNEMVYREHMRMHVRLMREDRKDEAERVQAVELSQYVHEAAKTTFKEHRTTLRVVA